MEPSFKILLNSITTFIFDVDGVFTDGSVLVDDNGGLLRSMNIKDGYAVKVALEKGYNVCIITGGTNEGVLKRFTNLGVKHIFMGAHHKLTPLHQYFEAENIAADQVLYMGDDLPDIPPMQVVGLPSCPQDAVAEVKAASKYISHKKGGNGAVRDVIEQVLKVRGDWMLNFDASNA